MRGLRRRLPTGRRDTLLNTGTRAGEIAIVRDGGLFHDNQIRQVVDPGSGLTWSGLWSEVHPYPAQQRFYTITADPKRATALGVDVVTTPSSDGVNLGIEGTLYFTLNLDHETLKRFDDKFGTRTFRGQDRFLTGLRFNLVRVTLPQDVQRSVDSSLAAAASVAEAQAKVDQAEAEAAANRARQDRYDRCPACAEIDKLKSLPQGITVYAPGNPDAVVVPSR
ncbi:hypothetical protein Misp01_27660 [Microtetraspora sp. NBRC 13810]|uniref:SPFH domain-containing protein n=1 Tax=Microtetraspora sp. NBRC 13810 TaxID=3030990 RepID=UPI0024A520D4|nr:SPFH domain-containing protein [Microtetraspora sp. NBRC 13810]GLW07636.1 hypothetical protein Misp01_27660 [Microtetraspora sp. NBRC 13810]